MGREKWNFLLERADKKVFRIQRRVGKWIGLTRSFRGEVFEMVEERRVKTPPIWDFRTEIEAVAWAMTDNADAVSFGARSVVAYPPMRPADATSPSTGPHKRDG